MQSGPWVIGAPILSAPTASRIFCSYIVTSLSWRRRSPDPPELSSVTLVILYHYLASWQHHYTTCLGVLRATLALWCKL